MADFDIEKLLKQINELTAELNAAKKYGLVWDRESVPEDVVQKCKTYIPVLDSKKELIVLNGGNNNLLIEGDNFHSLTSLSFVMRDQVDIIYIDPPYNTGNEDYSYNDRFVNRDDGFRHSKWLNGIEKRLKLARELLKDSGVIFISIDDNEFFNLKLLCDQIFGENNYLGTVYWKSNPNGRGDSKYLGSILNTFFVTKNASVNSITRLRIWPNSIVGMKKALMPSKFFIPNCHTVWGWITQLLRQMELRFMRVT